MTVRETGDPGTIRCSVCKASVVVDYDDSKPGRPLVYYDVDNAQVNAKGKAHAHQPKPKEG